MIKRKPNPNKSFKDEALGDITANSPEINTVIDPTTGEFGTLAPKPNSEYTTEENTDNLRFIVGAEIARFKQKVKAGISLNDKETRQLGGLAETQRTVIEVEAQQAKLSKYDKMTTQELIQALFEAAMNFPEEQYIELIGRCLEKRPIK